MPYIESENAVKILVDECDCDLTCHRWWTTQDGYAHTWVNKKSKLLHRIILERKINRPLETVEHTDHINGNTTDNRRGNLRVATPSQNSANRKKNSNNTSGYRGVSLNKTNQRWKAQIKINGVKKTIGYFEEIVDAAKAYDLEARAAFGDFARTNF